MMLAIGWMMAPRFLSAQITPEMIEAAKKEGEVMFYGAITINSSKAIGDALEKKYGIKLKHWRGDATELINRSLAEARAGKPAFDVTLGNEVVMTALDERKSSWRLRSARRKELPKTISRPGYAHDAVASPALWHQLQ